MRKRLILVEDHEDLREVTAEWLEMAGFDVAAFDNAEDALAALDAQLPDALVTDLSLPSMSGVELAERARSVSAGRSLLIVALTGAAGVARSGLFDVVLTKPVDMERLSTLLRGG